MKTFGEFFEENYEIVSHTPIEGAVRCKMEAFDRYVDEVMVPNWDTIHFECSCGNSWSTTRKMVIAKSRQLGKTLSPYPTCNKCGSFCLNSTVE